jgi:glycosyltransferase involved in cell wall biosynthesis
MTKSSKKSREPGLVSIIMNCYNGEKYLREAIESIISQTYQNWELVFWDNLSTDSSKAIFHSYADHRLKYFLSPRHTDLGGGRSAAFKHLNGEYIAVLDVDDLWLPSKLEKQLKFFNDPEVGIVISNTMFFNESYERVLYEKNYPPEGYVFRQLFTGYFVSLETLMLRKSVVDRLEYGFDADFSFIADFDLVLRTAQISKLAVCKEVLAKWRSHEESDSWQSFVSFSKERERWIKKQIECNLNTNFATEYKNEISILHSKNFLDMAFSALLENMRIKAFKLILKTNFKDWREYVILFFCFVPFSNRLLMYLMKRRIRLLK